MRANLKKSRLSLIRIDHRNSLNSFNQDSLAAFKDTLYTELLELDEVDTNFVLKYLERTYFQEQDVKEFLKLTSKLHKLGAARNDPEEVQQIVEAFDIENETLILNEKNIADIAFVVGNELTDLDKKFNIKTEKDFYLQLTRKLASDILNFDSRPDENNYFNNESERRSTCESSIAKINESFYSMNESRISYYSKLNLLDGASPIISRINSSKLFKKAKKEFLKKTKEKFPENLFNLIQIFQSVKRIKIYLPDSKKKTKDESAIYNYLIVLLNLCWLLTSISHIKIDLESDLHKTKIGFDSNKSEKLSNQMKSRSLIKVVNDYKSTLELMMFIPYFISNYTNKKINQIETLKLNIPDSYQIELDFLLKREKMFVNNFHILDLLEFSTNLSTLHLTFNSLDSNTFKRVISIIHRNNKIRDLNLNIFPDELDEYYNSYQISKICNLNDVNLTTVKGNYFYYSNYNTNFSCIIDENENMLNALALQYQNNLENLVFILSRKVHNLFTLKINFDIPCILFISDKYTNAFHKFILNIFSLLDTSSTNETTLAASTIKHLELTSNNFTFNSRKYPFINDFLTNLNLKDNYSVNNLFLKMKFNKILNFGNLIPAKIEVLSICELDKLTFQTFVQIFENENYLEDLTKLEISLSDLLFDLNEASLEIIYEFFSLEKAKKLKEIIFSSNKLPLNGDNIVHIISIISKTKVPIYHLKTSSSHLSWDLLDEWKQQRTICNEKSDYKRIFPLIFSIPKFRRTGHKERIYNTLNQFLKKRSFKSIRLEYIMN